MMGSPDLTTNGEVGSWVNLTRHKVEDGNQVPGGPVAAGFGFECGSNLSGSMATMFPNHHISKPVLIGKIRDDGQFDIVWQTLGTIIGDAWTDYLPDSKNVVANWMPPLYCGNFNVKTATCSGQNY